MRTIVQIEYRPGLLTVREEILQFLGNPVVSVFGSQAARELDLSDKDVAVIRDFFGGLDRHKATKGLFVTTSTCSSAAKI